jgi:hypothetical protein
MPRHVYTVCSRLGSEDKSTTLVSLYHVIEELALARPEPGQLVFPFIFRVTSVWMREVADDEEQEYEHEIKLRLPYAAVEKSLAAAKFRFNVRFHRIMGDVLLQNALPEAVTSTLSGQHVMFIDSSIRIVGADTWQTYSYPISLVCNAQPIPEQANGEAAAGR